MKTLLIIDDDDDDVQIFCEALHEVNKTIHCFSANNGETALQLLKESIVRPDFIFLDLNMPRMHGNQFLTLLKKDAHLKHIPVIIYTTSKRERDAEEMRELGASHFLTKPSKFENLKKAIADILENKFESFVYDAPYKVFE